MKWGYVVTSHEAAADDSELRVLHALKVKGFAAPEAVSTSSGIDVETATVLLDAAVERGDAKHRTGRVTGYSLTPAGREHHQLLLRDDTTPPRLEAATTAYELFLGPNQQFKELTTAHQIAADGENPPDTAGALQSVDADVMAILDPLASSVPRFATYGPRFARARDAFIGGDRSMLAAPMRDSYHDVWMELHEDLLATLGRERTESDG